MILYTTASEQGRSGAMEGRGQGIAADTLLTLLDGRRLSPAQRRIAQYLLDHMPDSAFLSSVALARRAGVSQPSVTRFAATLGFSGSPAFRDALRDIALEVPGPGVPPAPGPHGPDGDNPMQAAVAAELANLRALHDLLADPRVVTELAAELAASVPLAVLGLRISAPVAEYFALGAAGRPGPALPGPGGVFLPLPPPPHPPGRALPDLRRQRGVRRAAARQRGRRPVAGGLRGAPLPVTGPGGPAG